MKRILAALLFLMLASPAWGQELYEGVPDVEKGLQAYAQRDYAEAVKWYRKAAEQSYDRAQTMLGSIYNEGVHGVPRDFATVEKWHRKAAEAGNANAQNSLGVMYAEGQGVPRDDVRAHMWFNLSAAQGGDYAIKNRDVTTEQMTPAQIAEAQRLARQWWAAFEKREKK